MDWLAPLWQQVQQELSVGQPPVWQIGAAALALLLLAWLLLQRLARRRTRELANALNDSTRGALVPSERPRATRLRAALTPPPEPFTHMGIEFALGGGGVLGAWLWRRQTLAIFAALPDRPRAELLWEAGRTPAQAVGRGAATSLWVTHRLPYGGSEYAVRGLNTAPLEHVFADLQTRYGPFLRSATIQANAMPHLSVRLAARRLNREDVPALITTVRALGRAALRT